MRVNSPSRHAFSLFIIDCLFVHHHSLFFVCFTVLELFIAATTHPIYSSLFPFILNLLFLFFSFLHAQVSSSIFSFQVTYSHTVAFTTHSYHVYNIYHPSSRACGPLVRPGMSRNACLSPNNLLRPEHDLSANYLYTSLHFLYISMTRHFITKCRCPKHRPHNLCVAWLTATLFAWC